MIADSAKSQTFLLAATAPIFSKQPSGLFWVDVCYVNALREASTIAPIVSTAQQVPSSKAFALKRCQDATLNNELR